MQLTETLRGVEGMRPRAVFVFDGGDLSVHDSLESAAISLEAIDVENGEFDFYTDDGTVVAATVTGEHVFLAPTTTGRQQEFLDRLDRFLLAVDAPAEVRSAPDVIDKAQYVVDLNWGRRWPKRPAWLARRIHGDDPPHLRRS